MNKILPLITLVISGCTSATYNVYNEMGYEKAQLGNVLAYPHPTAFLQIYHVDNNSDSGEHSSVTPALKEVLDGTTHFVWLQPGKYLFVMFCEWNNIVSTTYSSPKIMYTIEGGKSYSAACELVEEQVDSILGKTNRATAAKAVIREKPSFVDGKYYRVRESS